ncbi:DUF5720 family protein [Faecalibacterium sp.]
MAISIKATKLTANVLKAALLKALEEMEKKQKNPKIYKGKQSVKHLVRQGAGVSNIEITDGNMQEGKTIGQLMEEMRQKAGAQNYHGHDYMDLQRFAENTRHMIIFDVLTHDSPVGWKGERTRLFLSDIGYEKALDSQANGQIKILSHAKVRNGDLFYDHKEQIR